MGIGAAFSILAALMAFLISYEEYKKHFLDKRKPVIISLQSAGVIFLFFLIVTFAAAFAFSNPAFMK